MKIFCCAGGLALGMVPLEETIFGVHPTIARCLNMLIFLCGFLHHSILSVFHLFDFDAPFFVETYPVNIV